MEIEIVCVERNPQGRIIRISQTGGPLISLNKMKELVMKAEHTYIVMKNDEKLKIYATRDIPF